MIKNNKEMTDVMIDLETLGTSPNSVICSVAAVEFNINTGQTGRTFYELVSMKSCLDLGMNVEEETVKWWLTKSEQARAELAKAGKAIHQVLVELNTFLGPCDDLIFWSNSPSFDLVILGNAYRLTYINKPWHHRNERDVRTLSSLAPHFRQFEAFKGTAHNPVDDCTHQISYCHKSWAYLKSLQL